MSFDVDEYPEALASAQIWMRRYATLTTESLAQASSALLMPVIPSFALIAADALTQRLSGENVTAWLTELLRTRAAKRSTDERVSRRLLFWARANGMNQREIARAIRKPQTAVFRQLKEIENDPSLLAFRPSEIYENFLAKRIDRETLIDMLAAFPYEPGEYSKDEPDWGYIPGGWDELTQLAIDGSISQDELRRIVSTSEAVSPRNG
ncbi:hypothetical protein [Herbiconiux sp. YIM B11900]|uniref:hypothetical protein n=1 Tax=Herbiconiux sp. YIM B11900 TaxID=3404131 RepID=UPI003F876EBC